MGGTSVCFDLGGVLVRIRGTWRLAAAKAGVEPQCPSGRLEELGGFAAFEAFQGGELTLETYLPSLAAHLGLKGVEEARRVHHAILAEPYPGTEELIAELHAHDVRTLCLSNTNAPHWDRMCGPEFPGIAALRHKFASHELKLQKPDLAIYEALERAAGLAPHEVVFFEDGPANIQGARARGWRAHLIDPHGDPAAQMREHLCREGVLG